MWVDVVSQATWRIHLGAIPCIYLLVTTSLKDFQSFFFGVGWVWGWSLQNQGHRARGSSPYKWRSLKSVQRRWHLRRLSSTVDCATDTILPVPSSGFTPPPPLVPIVHPPHPHPHTESHTHVHPSSHAHTRPSISGTLCRPCTHRRETLSHWQVLALALHGVRRVVAPLLLSTAASCCCRTSAAR